MIREIFGGTIPLLEKALDQGYMKHNVISSNIANEETPNYKARDLDFQGELEKSMSSGTSLEVTHGNHIRGLEISQGQGRVTFSRDASTNLDNNNVSLEKELVKMAENTVRYNAHASILARKFQGLREAIREGR